MRHNVYKGPEDREQVSLFNKTKSKSSIKIFRVTLLQQILNASHVNLMTEINVCKR